MILGESQQTFASPGEALEHHGVKGMRWGVRNEDKPVGRMTATPKPALSERKQRKVEQFQKRSDVMGTKISELKLRNQKLEGTRNLGQKYDRYTNKQTIKQLEKEQQRALKDAEAVQKGKLTSKQKKVILGAVVVGGIAAYAVYTRGEQSGAFNAYAHRGAAFLRGEKVPFRVNPKLTGPMSHDQLLSKVVKPVNPLYSTPGGHMNCRRSTYVYELRRRGFDVRATTSAVGWGQSESGVINAVTPGSRNFYRSLSMSQAVVNSGGSTVARGDKRLSPLKKIVLSGLDRGGESEADSVARILENVRKGRPVWEGAADAVQNSGSKRVFEELAKQPSGARGEVMFKFPSFGHSMAWEIIDGVPHVFDSQKGTYHDLVKTVEEKWGPFSGAEITRLDNVDLDLNFLARWAANTKG